MNRFLSLFSLLAVFLWLLFSYLPSELFQGLQLAFPPAVMPLMLWGAVGILIGFLFIQLVLVRSAIKMGHAPSVNQVNSPVGDETSRSLKVSIGWELVWTILPLILTIGVAIVGYQRWLEL